MNIADGAVALDAIARQNERLIGLTHILNRGLTTFTASAGLDIRHLRPGPFAMCYLEYTLPDTRVLAWIIDVTWTENWAIESSVRINDDNGQTTLQEFMLRTADNAATFSQELAATLDEITQSILRKDNLPIPSYKLPNDARSSLGGASSV